MPVLRRSHKGEGRPCVHCGHDYGRHAAYAGRCALEQCDCRGYLAGGADASGAVRVVTPAQLRDGFVRQRGIGDPGDRCDYAVIRRLDDGNYLVKDPGPPASRADLERELHYMASQVEQHGFPGTRAVLAELERLSKENAKLRQAVQDRDDTLSMVIGLPGFQRRHPQFAEGILTLLAPVDVTPAPPPPGNA